MLIIFLSDSRYYYLLAPLSLDIAIVSSTVKLNIVFVQASTTCLKSKLG